jgi:type IV pilus assembly protein PilV
MMISELKNNDGFTLLELLISITILAVGLLAVAQMQVRAMQGNQFAKHVTESTTWAEDKMEELMTRAYSDPLLAVGNYTEANPPSGYTITYTIAAGSATNTKLITMTVTPVTGTGRATTLMGIKAQL